MKTRIRLLELPSLGTGSLMADALRMIRGVEQVKAEPDEKQVTVWHDGVPESELLEAIGETGIDAEVIQDSEIHE